MLFVDYLRELRKTQGLTQDQLSDMTVIRKHFISRIENNHDKPPSEELLNAVWPKLYKVDPYKLIVKAGKVPDNFKKLIIEDPEVYKFLVTKIKQRQ